MKFLLATLITFGALAKVQIKDARIRLMPPGWKSTAAFVTLTNDSDKPVEIVSAEADFAKKIELHTHAVEEGVMRMRQVESMEVPAKGKLVLQPHGNHLMVFGMKEELKEGAKKKIILKSSKGEKLEVEFTVKNLNKESGQGHSH